MASGSSNRPNSGSKGFDFASDDILCSYEDYVNQNNNSDGAQSDPSLPANPTQVHRSVQILRDKQELAKTQKELAKLQFAQKESSSQEEKTIASTPEPRKNDDVSDTPNTQLALALPSQIPTQPSHANVLQQSPVTPPQPPLQAVNQPSPYYQLSQFPNPPNHSQLSYQTVQSQQYPQYQQQWSQQVSQPMPPPQQPTVPPTQQSSMLPPQQPPIHPGQPPNQMRPLFPARQSQVYPPYMPSQQPNPPAESMVQFPGTQQSGAGRPESMPYGYGGTGRPVQPQGPQLPPQHMKGGFPAYQADGYASGGSLPLPISSGGSYMLYDSEGGRPLHSSQPTHYSQSGYPPHPPQANIPPPNSSL